MDRFREALMFADDIAMRLHTLLENHVRRVGDHKGTLTVVWKTEPGLIGRRLMETAWEHVGEHCVEHEVEQLQHGDKT